MIEQFKRRDFLRLCGHWEPSPPAASPASKSPSSRDRHSVVDKPHRVLIDGSQNIFNARQGGNVSPNRHHGSRISSRTTQSMGCLYLQSQRGNEQRTIMLDFGYTRKLCSTISS
jgi:7,8-dihydropterin-6-yl-methyl-4-(beta-D-ribofuranosyl)aminobenzene 5'-phosphate synthase